MGLHIRIGQNPHGLRRKIVPIFPGLQTFRVLSPDHLQRAFAEENLRGGFSASTTASMAPAVASGLSRAMVPRKSRRPVESSADLVGAESAGHRNVTARVRRSFEKWKI